MASGGRGVDGGAKWTSDAGAWRASEHVGRSLSETFERSERTEVDETAALLAGSFAGQAMRDVAQAEDELKVEVLKFGGSSVGDASCFRAKGELLSDMWFKSSTAPCVVLSAVFGVTDALVASFESADDLARLAQLRRLIHERHVDVIDGLFPTAGPRASDKGDRARQWLHSQLGWYMMRDFDQVIARQQSRMVGTEPPPISSMASSTRTDAGADFDRIQSLGERMSAIILETHLITHCALPAVALDPSRLISTTGTAGAAMPDLSASQSAVDDSTILTDALIHRKFLPVFPGFYGSIDPTPDPATEFAGIGSELHWPTRGIVTFGRGGSDLSATVIASLLGAHVVSLWKVECDSHPDPVTGIKTFDAWKPGFPGVVHDADVAATIPALTFEEAGVLAALGKEVLHKDTVMPLVDSISPIVVNICNSLDRDHAGTLLYNPTKQAPGLYHARKRRSSIHDPAHHVVATRKPGSTVVSTVVRARNPERVFAEARAAVPGADDAGPDADDEHAFVALVGHRLRRNYRGSRLEARVDEVISQVNAARGTDVVEEDLDTLASLHAIGIRVLDKNLVDDITAHLHAAFVDEHEPTEA